jgi:chromosome partitioning protein
MLSVLSARYARASGARVLVVDLDLNNSSSFSLVGVEDIGARSIGKALAEDRLEPYIMEGISGIDLVPSQEDVLDVSGSIGPKRLRSMLEREASDYDVVMVDTGPCWNIVTVNGVEAADRLVIPLEVGQWDIRTSTIFVERLMRKLRWSEEDVNERVTMLCNGYSGRFSANPESVNAQLLDLAEDTFGDLLWDEVLPTRPAIKRATDAGTVISRAKSKIQTFEALARFFQNVTGVEAGNVERF